MPATARCPDASVLQQFAFGEMSPEQVEPLAQHVEQCPHCTRTLDALHERDTLVEAISARPAGTAEPPVEEVNALIARLKTQTRGQ